MAVEKRMTTEKEIIRDVLEKGRPLTTDVHRFEPEEPDELIENHVRPEVIGAYRAWESRMAITAELEILRQFSERDQIAGFPEAGPREWLYFNPRQVRIGIVTAGGPAPGLNTVIHSIVNMHKDRDNALYSTQCEVRGFLGGFRGLSKGEYEVLDPQKTFMWPQRGGTELRTSRTKQSVKEMVDVLKDKQINILYVVGGDGSLNAGHEIATRIIDHDIETSHILRRHPDGIVEEVNRRIVVACVPKTMDNDILWVWRSFGFDTAVEEATKMINAIHDDAKSTERVCLMQLFGRDAGFVAAQATLASDHVDAVLIPEEPYSEKSVLDCIVRKVRDNGHALLVIAEGAVGQEYDERQYVRDRLERQGLDPESTADPVVTESFREGRLIYLKDLLENEIREKFPDGRHEVFVSQPRHLIRAVSANSADQTHCKRLADMAVHSALAGFTDFMITQWLSEYVLVPLDTVLYPYGDNTPCKKAMPTGIFWKTVQNSTGQPSFKR